MDTSVICSVTKQVYKKHIKMKLNKAALKELNETQGGHSKVNSIKYSQEYLKSQIYQRVKLNSPPASQGSGIN